MHVRSFLAAAILIGTLNSAAYATGPTCPAGSVRVGGGSGLCVPAVTGNVAKCPPVGGVCVRPVRPGPAQASVTYYCDPKNMHSCIKVMSK